MKIKVQSSVLVNRRFPGHEAVTCGAPMPWLVPSYLWLIPNGHYFPNIVNEAHQLEPVCGREHISFWYETGASERAVQPLSVVTFVRVCLADALGRLEGVEGVGEVHVGIGLVHQLV